MITTSANSSASRADCPCVEAGRHEDWIVSSVKPGVVNIVKSGSICSAVHPVSSLSSRAAQCGG